MECTKISVKKGDISFAAFLRSKFGSSLVPGALSEFSSLNYLVIPDCVISILSMGVVGGPSNLGILVVSSSVNTEQNCWLRISALRLLSECWFSVGPPSTTLFQH